MHYLQKINKARSSSNRDLIGDHTSIMNLTKEKT